MRMIKMASLINRAGVGDQVDEYGMKSGYRASDKRQLVAADATGTVMQDNGRISRGRQMIDGVLRVSNCEGK